MFEYSHPCGGRVLVLLANSGLAMESLNVQLCAYTRRRSRKRRIREETEMGKDKLEANSFLLLQLSVSESNNPGFFLIFFSVAII